jgi:hypothetical protein
MTPDPVLLLAWVIMGEASLVPDAMPLVAHAVMNRVAHPAFPDTIVEVVEQPGQWNGRQQPNSLALYWARQVVRRDRDPTNGVLFVLSGADVNKLGCVSGDANMIYVNWNWSVHGYVRWCQND